MLIKPDIPNLDKKGPQKSIILPPLGLEIIGTYIADIADVRIIDCILYEIDINSLKDIIAEYCPDYVGISCCYTFQIEYTLKIARIAKELGAKTVLGGWHPSLVTEETLSSPYVDIIVRGEGELTFRELIKKNSPVGIKGLSYKEGGKQIHNEDRDLMDLRNLRIVDRSYREINGKYFYHFFGFPIDCMEVSRGCPFSCDFCCIHNFYRHTYRKRSIKSVIKELKIMESHHNHSDFIYIVDDNFVVDYKYVMDLCDAIIENGIKKYFFAQARVDMIVNHPEVFKKMADAGFVLLFIGLESFSNQTLETINKQIKFQQIKAAIRIAHNFGYIIQGSVIIGANLDDTPEDLALNVKMIKNLDVDIPTFSLLTPFPGTKLMERVKEQDLLLSTDWSDYNWSKPILKYKNLNPDDLYDYFSEAYNLREFKTIWKHIKQLIFGRGLKFHLSRLYSRNIHQKAPKFIKTTIRLLFNSGF